MIRHTDDDVAALQALLERSALSAGDFLRDTFEMPGHALTARQLTGYFEQRIRSVAVATVTARGEPRVSPVGAFFYGAKFHIPTAAQAVRVRHLRSRPAISLTHFVLNSIAVIVHGRAEILTPEHPQFADLASLDTMRPEKWWRALHDQRRGVIVRVEARLMYAWAKDPSQFPS